MKKCLKIPDNESEFEKMFKENNSKRKTLKIKIIIIYTGYKWMCNNSIWNYIKTITTQKIMSGFDPALVHGLYVHTRRLTKKYWRKINDSFQQLPW